MPGTDKTSENTGNNKSNKVKQESSTPLALPNADNNKKQQSSGTTTTTTGKKNENAKSGNSNKNQTDPNKMQDVLISAGVDIREEEALLTGSITASRSQAKANNNSVNNANNNTVIPPHLPFLHPDQVTKFMKHVSKEHHFNQNYLKNLGKNNGEVLDMISTSCETYMKDILTNALIISRHRRRGVQLNTGRRSEVSMALKSMAQLQKKEEERRLKKRIALGLEKEDLENKIDSEETLHRASNVTAGLRAGSKKQYGWLTASVAKPTTSTIKSAGKIANEIAARGESGLRFREAREEPGIVMRDLLFALENRRNGVQNIITKGYSRIRD
ncbi:transcription initiation factor TFIID subunit 4 [Monosporozyma unispora]|nr:transcription initiation factor TFIID subunit 4 [Kazachstania unispora]